MSTDSEISSPPLQENILRNFHPIQSGLLAVGATSASVTFSAVVSSIENSDCVTAKITNKGSSGAYVAAGIGATVAVPSSSTPGGNCDYFAAGSIQLQDYPAGTNVFAAIQDTGATNLEISVGYGN